MKLIIANLAMQPFFAKNFFFFFFEKSVLSSQKISLTNS